MYILKGFTRISDLVDNIPGEVALLGELSSKAMTYAKEKGYYSDPTIPKIEVVSFTSNLIVGNNTTKIVAPDEVSALAIDIGKWVMDHAQETTLFGEENGSYPDYLEALHTAFPNAGNLTMGPLTTLVIADATDKSMPEWLSWTSVYDTDEEASSKIWYVDTAFRGQYDDYEIIVVPPIDNLDQLFQSRSVVQGLVNAITFPALTLKVANAAGNNPYTDLKSINYNWQDTLQPPNIISMPWSLIIYGAAGNNIDVILETLRQYILAHSTHDEDDWITRLPDIFRTTEFVVVPMWQRYAIPNQVLQTGVYSAIVRNVDDYQLVLDAVNYPDNHIQANLESTVFLHNYISAYFIGGMNNLEEKFRISDHFGDYIPAATVGSGDFNRMAPLTQEWIIFMLSLLAEAEMATEFSTIPLTMSRLKRDGVLMISGNYDNIQYLVVTKKYFLDNVQSEEL